MATEHEEGYIQQIPDTEALMEAARIDFEARVRFTKAKEQEILNSGIQQLGMCAHRFCHSLMYEFGLCKKHWEYYEQLFAEFFARTGKLSITIIEETPRTLSKEHWWYKKAGTYKGKSKRQTTSHIAPVIKEPEKIDIAAVNASVNKLAAMKAKLAKLK